MLRRLIDRLRRRGRDDGSEGAPTARDYAQEREDSRQAGLSDEDRAWQEASLQRDQERREREGSPSGG